MNLIDKTIVLTGGTSGVGKELTSLLTKKNKVIVIGRSKEKLAALKNDFEIETYLADLSNLEEVEAVIKGIQKAHKEIDVLINNAALQFEPKFTDQNFSIENVGKEVTTNFTSICHLIYGLLPSLNKSTRSIILNINSGLAFAPKTSSAVYSATKSALNSLSTTLQYQLNETNVKVIQAFLPLVDTKMTQGRGTGKISASKAANSIISGLEGEKERNYIGKVKILMIIMRLFPSVARKIMRDL